ncbi:MAG TPA: hypothetical protein ENN13_04330 [Candidatus Altiarchaeales archaeon]|nr:hypothetical protein [Candidatus Altiarchaeales archaeon]
MEDLTINLLKILGKREILVDSFEDVKEMHQECLEMFKLAWEALEENDEDKAELVIGKDDKVDELEVLVRENVLTYLAAIPVGGNIPLSLVLLDTSNQLERLADHVCFIADSSMKYPCLDADKYSKMLRQQKGLALKMLENVSTAIDTCDENVAEKVVGMYERLKDEYENFIEEVDKSSDLPMHRAIGLILVSRNLLRIGKKSKSIMEFCLKPYPEAG